MKRISLEQNRTALAVVIGKYMAAVLVGGMAIYGAVEYFLVPDITFTHLILEHLGHVVFLMILVYITLYYLLLRTVVVPIRQFRSKLYRIAGGELTPVENVSRIREVQDMADGINLMIERFSGGLPDASLGELAVRGGELKDLAKSSDNLEMVQKETLLNTASEIDAVIALFTSNSIRKS